MSIWWVKKETIGRRRPDEYGSISADEVVYDGQILQDDDSSDLMVWDDALQNIRAKTDIETLEDLRADKRNDLKTEALKRANSAYGESLFENHAQISLFQPIISNGSESTIQSIVNAHGNADTALENMNPRALLETYDVVNTPAWP